MNVKLLLAQVSTFDLDVRFFNYAEVLTRHGEINLENYQQAYEYDVAILTWDKLVKEKKTIAYLDRIYQKFNLFHPEDYQNRSLSVGDLVLIDDMDMFFIDSIGYKKLDPTLVKGTVKGYEHDPFATFS